jgi:hypothetical protein
MQRATAAHENPKPASTTTGEWHNRPDSDKTKVAGCWLWLASHSCSSVFWLLVAGCVPVRGSDSRSPSSQKLATCNLPHFLLFTLILYFF